MLTATYDPATLAADLEANRRLRAASVDFLAALDDAAGAVGRMNSAGVPGAGGLAADVDCAPPMEVRA